MKRVIFWVGLTLSILQGWAANALWDCFAISGQGATSSEPGYYTVEWHNDEIYPSILLRTTRDGTGTTMDGYGSLVEFMGLWIEASLGETIDAACFSSRQSVVLNGLPGSDYQEAEVRVDGRNSVLFAFEVFSLEQDPGSPYGYVGDKAYYGWVELVVEKGTVSIGASYLDLEGRSVYAGRYESGATPEPRCGLLLVVGIGVLVLRRRRHFRSAENAP